MPLRYLVDEHLRGTLPQVVVRVARERDSGLTSCRWEMCWTFHSGSMIQN